MNPILYWSGGILMVVGVLILISVNSVIGIVSVAEISAGIAALIVGFFMLLVGSAKKLDGQEEGAG